MKMSKYTFRKRKKEPEKPKLNVYTQPTEEQKKEKKKDKKKEKKDKEKGKKKKSKGDKKKSKDGEEIEVIEEEKKKKSKHSKGGGGEKFGKLKTEYAVDSDSEDLTDFLNCMNSWKSKEEKLVNSRIESIACLQALMSFLKDKEETRNNIVVLVGNQSAGKTSLAMGLTQQVAFLTDPKTGTRSRTLIKSRFRGGNTTTINFKYNHTSGDGKLVVKEKRDNQNSSAIFSLHCDIFSNRFKGYNSNYFDQKDVCEYEINSHTPTFGLVVMDHPGLVFSGARATISITQKSIDDYFAGEKGSRAIFLLCQKIGMDADECYLKPIEDSTNPSIKNLNVIPPEDYFVAITKMDMILGAEIGNRLISSYANIKNSGEKGPIWYQKIKAKKKGEKYPIDPLVVLQYIKWEMVTVMKGKIPEGARFFFVTSCKAQTDTLMGIPETERWDYFDTNFKNGRKATEDKFLRICNTPKDWDSNFDLTPLDEMNDGDANKFFSMVGMNNLLRALLERQYEGALLVADNVEKIVSKNLSKIRKRRKYALSQIKGETNYANLMKKIAYDFFEVFCTIGTHNPSNMARNLSSEKSGIDIFQQHKEKEEETQGWTTKEEILQYNKLKTKTNFPDSKFRRDIPSKSKKKNQDECWDRFVAENFENYVANHDVRLFILQMLITRLQQEYSFLTGSITIGEVGKEEILRAQNPVEAIQKHVNDEYKKLFGRENGGHRFIAGRTSLNFLLLGKTILDVFFHHPLFYPIFSVKGGKKKIDLFRGINKTSFVQRESSKDSAEGYVQPTIRDEQIKLLEFCTEVENRKKKPKKNHMPREDLKRCIIASLFDQIYKEILNELNTFGENLLSAKAKLSYLPSFLHYAPLLIHQDREFVKIYTENERNYFAKTFLGGEMKKKGGIAKNAPFERMSQNRIDRIKETFFLEKSTNDEDVDLITSLILLKQSPDHMAEAEFGAGVMGEYHLRFLNYVVKRYLSSSIVLTREESLRLIARLVSSYSGSVMMKKNAELLLERYVSLLLGYDYPYLFSERPRNKWYLNIDHVIPFLYDKKKDFENNNLSVLFDERYKKIAKSPLCQEIVSLYLSNPSEAANKVYVLFKKYQSADVPRIELNFEIIELLTDLRYAHMGEIDMWKDDIRLMDILENKFSKYNALLTSFTDFLRKYGKDISGINELPPKIKSLRPNF